MLINTNLLNSFPKVIINKCLRCNKFLNKFINKLKQIINISSMLNLNKDTFKLINMLKLVTLRDISRPLKYKVNLRIKELTLREWYRLIKINRYNNLNTLFKIRIMFKIKLNHSMFTWIPNSNSWPKFKTHNSTSRHSFPRINNKRCKLPNTHRCRDRLTISKFQCNKTPVNFWISRMYSNLHNLYSKIIIMVYKMDSNKWHKGRHDIYFNLIYY